MHRILTAAAATASLSLLACAGVDGTHRGGLVSHHSHVGPAPAAAPVEVAEVAPPDRDGDGVEDAFDNCPDVAGTAENNGCEAPQMVAIKADGLEIKERIYFATGSDVIEERSYELLDQVAAVLAHHGEFGSVRIEGHTDNTGNADFNRQLSERRAKAVLSYIATKGVPENRLEARGFGDEKPRASNETAEGRSENRRVEFRFVTEG